MGLIPTPYDSLLRSVFAGLKVSCGRAFNNYVQETGDLRTYIYDGMLCQNHDHTLLLSKKDLSVLSMLSLGNALVLLIWFSL